jgi:succinate dehydrogenase / fumarate reductase iron-sulfur subunit
LRGKGEDPIAFDSDCREGICGTCGLMVDGVPHGPDRGTTICQLHMRRFKDGDTIVIEPWRARAFPIVKDLVVDRSAFDRIIGAGGYTSINVGCGACVASCKNASAALFTSAKIAHLGLLPQGQPESRRRVRAMVDRMDAEGFGSCSNEGECQAVCPKEISISAIARMNREYAKAVLLGR